MKMGLLVQKPNFYRLGWRKTCFVETMAKEPKTFNGQLYILSCAMLPKQWLKLGVKIS